MKLFVMTGKIQTGKTTWIRNMLHQVGAAVPSDEGGFGVDVAAPVLRRVQVAGVYAPAVFAGGEKTAIDNVLLPSGKRFCFAPRYSAAEREALLAAGKTRVGWKFSSEAIERVNAHLGSPACRDAELLLIDELGWIEFEQGGGFTNGMRLLSEGAAKNALIVVREDLLGHVERLWGTYERLDPTSSIPAFLEALE